MIDIFINLIIIITLFYLSIVDIKKMIVEYKGIAIIFIAGAALWLFGETELSFHIKGCFIITSIAFLIAYITKGLGGGDVKLFSAIGFAFGICEATRILMLSFLLSGIFVILIKLIPLSITPISQLKVSKEIPFVPFIAASAFLIFIQNLLYLL